LKEVKPKQNLKGLLKAFKTFLYKECKQKPGYHKSIESIYGRLFRISKESGSVEKRYIPGEVGNEPSVNVAYTIVTTNYDMIIESYHMMKELQYADGFKQTLERPLIREMDLTTYSPARRRWLVKLHGSIWQYKYGNNIFKTNEDPKNISSFPIKIEEEMMIYPTGEKPMLKYPYYNFYNVFKKQQWNKLIAIGYSFRDEPVNLAILENLKKVEYSNLIVVNPNPEKTIQNMGIAALPNDRIIPIKGKFGDEKVFQQLEIALKVESKSRFQQRLKEKEDEILEAFGRTPEDLK